MSALAEETDPLDMLAEDLARFYADPLGFVLWAFAWGRGELAQSPGPRKWQREFLEEIGRQVRDRGFDGFEPVEAIRMATASGHGIGKSALSAWIILWIMATRPNAKGTVTANTADQLRTKTWAELGKWWKRSLVREMFNWTGGKGSLAFTSVEAPESWRCDGITSREENSEAFAGQHAAGSTPFYLFDEASAVPDVIYEVAEGGLTDGEPMIFLFGNPTRNTGRFRETHGRLKHRWTTRQIDSRDVEGTNKALFAEWEQDYGGDDSDFFRVRVKGQFPRASSMQFIPSDTVQAARKREAQCTIQDALVVGVDVARFGDDQGVLVPRKGLDARTHPWRRLRGADTMEYVGVCVEMHKEWGVDMFFVDEGGIGAGVVDRLRQLGIPVTGVNFGGKADRPDLTGKRLKSHNKSAEMWGFMRDALASGLAIEDSDEVEQDLTGREYGYDANNAIVLEKKDDMKRRGLPSPDNGDGLALTYAYPAQPRVNAGGIGLNRANVIAEYDPYA